MSRLTRLAALASRCGLKSKNGVLWKLIYRESDIFAEGWFFDEKQWSGFAWALSDGENRALFGGPWTPTPWAEDIKDSDEALSRAEREPRRPCFITSGTSPYIRSHP